MTTGSVKAPTPEQLRDVAAELGMSFDDTQLEAHMAALLPGIAAYNIVDRLPDEKPAVTWPRTPSVRPLPEDNSHGAWYVNQDIARSHGVLGRSEGCFAMASSSLEEVMARLGPGHLIYADKIGSA